MRKWILSVLLVVCCVYATVLMMYSLNDREAAPESPSASQTATPSGSPSAQPSKPVDEAAATALYKSNCLSCHGDQLQGQIGPALTNVGASMTSDQIYKQIKNGGGGMPKFEGVLTDDQIRTLTDWLAAKK
ncbi:c-type cytochrome [Cohnella thermotolerans]|uniref:c-type cytochrome n=1 Tax=Cohnella thermotolerans TaxID=329858 RepID=UPI000422C506|nr:cytochrome c [Cohnella thermotolerans]